MVIFSFGIYALSSTGKVYQSSLPVDPNPPINNDTQNELPVSFFIP